MRKLIEWAFTPRLSLWDFAAFIFVILWWNPTFPLGVLTFLAAVVIGYTVERRLGL